MNILSLKKYINIKIFLKSNLFFKIFLGILAVIALFMNVSVLIKIYNFQRLSGLSYSDKVSFEIIEQKGCYKILANFEFENDGQIYLGKTLFHEEFLNQFAALDTLEQYKNTKTRKVFFDPKNLNSSTLEKLFPYRSVIYAIFSLIIFIYFLFFKKLFLKHFLD